MENATACTRESSRAYDRLDRFAAHLTRLLQGSNLAVAGRAAAACSQTAVAVADSDNNR